MTERWQTILAVDFDKWAAATYAANFPRVEVLFASVADRVDRLPAADVILGGPPCQPFSLAGEGEGEADDRDCIPDFVATVRHARPRQFLMENVKGLLTAKHWPYFCRAVDALAECGYVVQWRLLDAVNYGVPQFRERVWAWGIRSDVAAAGARHRWPESTHAWPPPEPCMFGAALLPGVTVGQALGIAGRIWMDRGAGLIERSGSCEQSTDNPSYTIRGAAMSGLKVVTYDHGVADPAAPSPTLKAGGNYSGGRQGGGCPPALAVLDSPAPAITGGSGKHHVNGLSVVNKVWRKAFGAVVDHPSHTISGESREPIQGWKGKGYVRRLTPAECARLQSVPDSFVWPDGLTKTNAYRIVGNGWACGQAAHLSRALAAADPDSRTVIDLFCGGGLGACGWHGRAWTYEPEFAAAG